MKKNTIKLNPVERTIIVSKSFYKKATTYGTDEYRTLRQAMEENPGFTVDYTTTKKTYNGLSFKRMEEYILTQENSEARLIEFKAIRATAKAKGAEYPLTKKWFFATYPEYKENTIVASDKAMADAKAALDEEAKEAAKKDAWSQNNLTSIGSAA